MRTLAVLLAAAAAALCSSTLSGELRGSGGLDLPETDYICDSYAYQFGEEMSQIPGSFGDYAVIDDLVVSWGSDIDLFIEEYTTWGVTPGNSTPSEMALLIVEDDGGVPSGAPISQDVYSVDCYNIGYTYYQYIIWKTDMYCAPYNVEVSTPVWLGPQRQDGARWYVIGGVTASESEAHRTVRPGWDWQPFSQSLEEGDVFKIVVGSSYDLQRSTWGGIKALIQ